MEHNEKVSPPEETLPGKKSPNEELVELKKCRKYI